MNWQFILSTLAATAIFLLLLQVGRPIAITLIHSKNIRELLAGDQSPQNTTVSSQRQRNALLLAAAIPIEYYRYRALIAISKRLDGLDADLISQVLQLTHDLHCQVRQAKVVWLVLGAIALEDGAEKHWRCLAEGLNIVCIFADRAEQARILGVVADKLQRCHREQREQFWQMILARAICREPGARAALLTALAQIISCKGKERKVAALFLEQITQALQNIAAPGIRSEALADLAVIQARAGLHGQAIATAKQLHQCPVGRELSQDLFSSVDFFQGGATRTEPAEPYHDIAPPCDRKNTIAILLALVIIIITLATICLS